MSIDANLATAEQVRTYLCTVESHLSELQRRGSLVPSSSSQHLGYDGDEVARYALRLERSKRTVAGTPPYPLSDSEMVDCVALLRGLRRPRKVKGWPFPWEQSARYYILLIRGPLATLAEDLEYEFVPPATMRQEFRDMEKAAHSFRAAYLRLGRDGQSMYHLKGLKNKVRNPVHVVLILPEIVRQARLWADRVKPRRLMPVIGFCLAAITLHARCFGRLPGRGRSGPFIDLLCRLLPLAGYESDPFGAYQEAYRAVYSQHPTLKYESSTLESLSLP